MIDTLRLDAVRRLTTVPADPPFVEVSEGTARAFCSCAGIHVGRTRLSFGQDRYCLAMTREAAEAGADVLEDLSFIEWIVARRAARRRR